MLHIVSHWDCTARHNSDFPVQGHVLRDIIDQLRRVCRLSRVHVPCVVRDAFYFEQKHSACSKYSFVCI